MFLFDTPLDNQFCNICNTELKNKVLWFAHDCVHCSITCRNKTIDKFKIKSIG